MYINPKRIGYFGKTDSLRVLVKRMNLILVLQKPGMTSNGMQLCSIFSTLSLFPEPIANRDFMLGILLIVPML